MKHNHYKQHKFLTNLLLKFEIKMNRFYKVVSRKTLAITSRASLGTFSKSNRGSFFQQEPTLGNQYNNDTFMREQLALELPKEVYKKNIIK
jgi:hypothetical protein